MAFDPAVVVDRHVRWQLLTTDEQTKLTANYPRQAGVNPPGAGVFGDAVNPQFERWLDDAYLLLHMFDSISVDPYP